jgi:hypothetical protein
MPYVCTAAADNGPSDNGPSDNGPSDNGPSANGPSALLLWLELIGCDYNKTECDSALKRYKH